MELNRPNIYKLMAGTIGVDIRTFNTKVDYTKLYKVDSLTVLEIALVIEDFTEFHVIIPDNILPTLHTAEAYADFVLEQFYNAEL